MTSQLNVDKIYNEGGDNDSGINLATNDTVKFDIAGSTKWTLNSSGNLFPSSTSQGICFGVTSDTAANRLEDYEEGTWTPSHNGVDSSTGAYVKIGKLVHLNGYVGSTDSTTGSAVSVSGLPFAPVNDISPTSHEAQGSVSYHEAVDSTSDQAGVCVIIDSNVLKFFKASDNRVVGDYDDHSGNWAIRFSVTYHTAA